MKTFFLIQFAISIIVASSYLLSNSPIQTKSQAFFDKINTIQSSRDKYIQYYQQKKTSKPRKAKSLNKEELDDAEILSIGQKSDLEIKILEAGFNPDHISFWFNHRQLSQIHIRKDSLKPLIVKNPRFKNSYKHTGKVLQLSSQEANETLKEKRNREFNENKKPKDDESDGNEPDNHEIPQFEPLSRKSFRVLSFKRGLTDDGKLIEKPNNYAFSIKGPDHYNDDINPIDKEKLKKLRERTISFGHGGEITLEITNDGFISDEPGPDFAIFENPFIIAGDLIYQEIAYVGVAKENKADSYKWFPCNPKKGILQGCAGLVPTGQGGDLFDLATLGIDRVRYIKIRDIGTNLSNFDKNTEGFDLDSLDIFHAYKDIAGDEEIKEQK